MLKTSEYKYTILIADDEAQNIETLFNTLTKENYKILIAPNGELAYKLTVENQPDAIIMDWDMPNMNGIEAIKKIRKNKTISYIPIIMATGKMTSLKNLKTALDAGANEYIRKPFDNIEIVARVKSMIKYSENFKKRIFLEKQIAEEKIKQLNKELDKNAEELAIQSLHLIQNANNQKLFLDNFIKLKENSNETGNKIIDTLISDIKINLNLFNWEEFELLFSKVHHNFYDDIIKNYHNLTKNERRLCIFIKLGMSNKDISAITFQSEQALKKAKYRLKQKLSIDSETNLFDFLQNFEI